MAAKNKDVDIRSDEVQDIMSHIPNMLIRYGMSGIFIVLVVVLFLSWLIRYPEIITGKITITTSVEPTKLVSKSSGSILQLSVVDGQNVPAGSVLAEIESPVSPGSVSYMRQYILRLENALQLRSGELPLPDTTSVIFGDVQPTVNMMIQELSTYNMNLKFQINEAETATLSQKIENQKKLIMIHQNIAAINQKELDNARLKYEADKKLAGNAFLSKTELMRSESELRAKELQVEQLRQTAVESSMVLSTLELQYNQSRFNNEAKSRSNLDAIHSAIETIRSYIFSWQQRYRITALQSGTVSFLRRIQQGQFLKGGEELFAITQPNTTYLGIATVPSSGFGKIAIGQQVHILLQSYPYYEYGLLEGTVERIAVFPNSNEYRVEITLPNGMTTTQHKALKFTPEMAGDAEIVTADKRVIERVFESLLKVMKRS
jgi:multidrug resistance efflux pump